MCLMNFYQCRKSNLVKGQMLICSFIFARIFNISLIWTQRAETANFFILKVPSELLISQYSTCASDFSPISQLKLTLDCHLYSCMLLLKAYGLAIWKWLFGTGTIFAKLLQEHSWICHITHSFAKIVPVPKNYIADGKTFVLVFIVLQIDSTQLFTRRKKTRTKSLQSATVGD